MNKIGFIGIGNMGFAMLNGLISKFPKEELTFTDLNSNLVKKVEEETKVICTNSNKELTKNCKYIILAVKPQFYNDVLEDIKDSITTTNIIISIAPSITIQSLKDKLGENIRIVRAMPNTPALICEGMSAVSFSEDNYTDEEKSTTVGMFETFGKCDIIAEQLMDVVVCASGSSPAYVYMFIEALADSAVKYGMPRDKAYKFVAQAVIGSAKMVLETGEHPGQLKDKVCSPGGTTIAGVSALEQYGFRNSIIKATDSCYEKIQNLKNI